MSATHLGFYSTASTRTHVRFQFTTHAAAGGNVAPASAFEAADLRIYKATDGAAFSATQRSSAAGITMTSPFDTLTGVHDVDIDLTDNTDASFYAAGSLYSVMLAPDETVDGQTLTGVILAYFEIGVSKADVTQFGGTAGTFASGRPEVNTSHAAGTAWGSGAITRGTFAAETGLQSIRSNTATAGGASTITLDASASAVNDFYNGTSILLTGGTGAGQFRVITDYVGATKVATVNLAWATNPDNTSTFAIFPAASTAEDVATSVWAATVRTLTAATNITSTGTATFTQTGDSYARIGANGSGLTAIDLPDQTMNITGNINGNLSGSVGSVTSVSDKTGYRLSATGVDDVLDELIGDGTLTLRQAQRIQVAVLAGELSGAATTTVSIRNVADSANVVVATVDADGNRTATVVTP